MDAQTHTLIPMPGLDPDDLTALAAAVDVLVDPARCEQIAYDPTSGALVRVPTFARRLEAALKHEQEHHA